MKSILHEMDDQDAADILQEQLEAQFPLESFRALAWLNFYDPAHGALDMLNDVFYESAAFGLVEFAQLSEGYNTTSEMQIERYRLDIVAWIDRWIREEMERLQQERWEMEL